MAVLLDNAGDTLYVFTDKELVIMRTLFQNATLFESNPVTAPAWLARIKIQFFNSKSGTYQIFGDFLRDELTKTNIVFQGFDDWLFNRITEILGPPSKEYEKPRFRYKKE